MLSKLDCIYWFTVRLKHKLAERGQKYAVTRLSILENIFAKERVRGLFRDHRIVSIVSRTVKPGKRCSLTL